MFCLGTHFAITQVCFRKLNWSGDGDRESIFVSIHEKAKSRFLSVSFFCIVEVVGGHYTSVLGSICYWNFSCVSSLHSFVLRRISRAISLHALYHLIVLPLGLYTAAREISADNYLQE